MDSHMYLPKSEQDKTKCPDSHFPTLYIKLGCLPSLQYVLFTQLI